MWKAFGRGFDSRRLHHNSAIAAVFFLIVFSALCGSQDNPITVFEGSRKSVITVQKIEGSDYVKITDLQPYFGFSITPIAGNQSLSIQLGEHNLILSANRALVSLDQKLVSLSQPVYQAQSDWYVPLDFLSKVVKGASEKQLLWLENSRSLIIGDVVPNTLSLKYSMETDHSRLVFQSSRPVGFSVLFQNGELILAPRTEDVLIGFQNADFKDGVLRKLSLQGSGNNRSIHVQVDQGYASYKSLELQDPPRLVIDFYRKEPVTAQQQPQQTLQPQSQITQPKVVSPTFLPSLTPRKKVVVIDPGHGGEETGAKGIDGTMEKDIVLSIARKLKSMLESSTGLRVILTRDGDEGIALDDRTALANNNKADLFISIHANATLRGYGKGAETYFLSTRATDDDARNTAAVENNALGLPQDLSAGGNDLKLILWDMAQTEYLTESSQLAETIQQELNQALGITNRGIKQAPFRVLMGATMPAVLIEVGFINNPAEEKLMKDSDYQMKLARAILRSIEKFQSSLYDQSVAPQSSGQ
jgi:N-acetylmuramoyl-L-alanine amidase